MRCPTCDTELLDDAICCPACGFELGREPAAQAYRYEAFISYRHTEADTRIAKRIQQHLEGFRIPRELQRGTGRDRLGRLFRDEDELPAGGSLTEELVDALRRSRFLIVVCSPQAVASQWVPKEVETFISLHGKGHVLAVLAEGDPETSYPDALRFIPAPESPDRKRPAEVIAADFRPHPGSSRPAGRRRVDREILRLAAPIIGCDLDDLAQRQRERRTRLLVRTAAAAAVVGISFGGFALWQRAQIESNYRAMQESQSEYLAKEAQELYADGKRMESIQVAMAALPSSETATDRAFVPAAQEALTKALNVYPSNSQGGSTTSWAPIYTRSDEPYPDSLAFSDEGLWYALPRSSKKVEIVDVATGEVLSTVNPPAPRGENSGSYLPGSVLAAHGDRLFLANGYREITAFEAKTGKQRWQARGVAGKDGLAALGEVSADGGRLLVFVGNSSKITGVVILDADSGDTVKAIDVEPLSWSGRVCAVSEDGSTGVIASGNSVRIIDVSAGTSVSATSAEGEVNSVDCAGSDVVVASSPAPSAAFSYSDASTLKPTDITESATSAVIEHVDRKTGGALWHYEAEWDSYRIEESALPFDIPAHVYGILKISDQEGIACVAAGPQLLLFKLSDGQLIYRKTFDSPIVYVWTTLAQKGPLYNVMTYQGNLYSSSPFENTSNALVDVDAGTIGFAHRFQDPESGSLWFLTRPTDEPDDLTAFSLAAHANLPGYKGIEGFTNGALNSDRTLAASLHSDGERLGVLDTASLDLSELSLDDLGIELSDSSSTSLTFSQTDPSILYVYESGSKTGFPAIWRVDVKRRAVTCSRAFTDLKDEGAYVYSRVQPERNGYITVSIPFESNIYALDAETLEATDSLAATPMPYSSQSDKPLPSQVADMLPIGPSLLVLDRDDGRVRLLDRDTQRAVDGFRELSVDADAIDLTDLCAVSPDESSFVLATADGELSAFDPADGSELWTVPFKGNSTRHLEYDGSGERLFTQDDNGTFSILDAATGGALSSLELENVSVTDIQADDTGQTLYLHGVDSATSGVVLALTWNDDSLAKLATIPLACAVLPDDQLVVFSDARSTFTLPLYSLDELLSTGREAVEGHELTDEQRRQYYLE